MSPAYSAPAEPDRSRQLRLLLLAQAAYFFVTGGWGVVHRRSFEWIAGPKTDYWLARTSGTLIAVIGVVLAASTRAQRQPGGATVLLATASAGGLGAVEAYYASRRRISLVYLADAFFEAGFVAANLLLWWPLRRATKTDASAERVRA